MIVKPYFLYISVQYLFESSVNSYDSQTKVIIFPHLHLFESSVNSYDSQTKLSFIAYKSLV